MSEELNPCPFCKEKPELDGEYCGTTYYRHQCNDVDFIGTVEEWNRRPIDDEQAARIAELEHQVDDLQGELAQSDKVSRIVELEAERDKYKEALEEIADWDMLAYSKNGLIAIIGVLVDKAKEALKGGGK